MYDLSDFQLVNLYDMTMGDYEIPRDELVAMIDSIEEEPNWDKFSDNGYGSREEFWMGYEALL